MKKYKKLSDYVHNVPIMGNFWGQIEKNGI